MIKIVNHCWIESEEMGEIPYAFEEIIRYFSFNPYESNKLPKNYKLPESLQFICDIQEDFIDHDLECDLSIEYEGEEDEYPEQRPEKTYIHFKFSYYTISCIQEYNSDNYYWVLRIEENKEPFAIAQNLPSQGFADPVDLPYFYDLENNCLTVISRNDWARDFGWYQAERSNNPIN